jgi:hypothetical protein
VQIPRLNPYLILSISLTANSLQCCACNEAGHSNLAEHTELGSGDSRGRQPSVSEREAISIAVLEQIGAWLVANFGLPPTKQMPDIEFVSQTRLFEIRYHDKQLAEKMSDGHRAGTVKGADSIIALYDPRGPKIFVTNEWRGESQKDVSVLVHEMVHHLQHAGRLQFDCSEARERLAYAAQDRWLADHGLSLSEAFGLDGFTMFARSSCSH